DRNLCAQHPSPRRCGQDAAPDPRVTMEKRHDLLDISQPARAGAPCRSSGLSGREEYPQLSTHDRVFCFLPRAVSPLPLQDFHSPLSWISKKRSASNMLRLKGTLSASCWLVRRLAKARAIFIPETLRNRSAS